jgi:glyoxylase I family protein
MKEVLVPALDAFSHLSLTVRDPQSSAGFYNRLLGSETVFASDDGSLVILARPGVMLALCGHAGTTDDTFDPARIGLDHIAFQVPTRDELEAWHSTLTADGVPCSEIAQSAFGLHLNLKDPDSIAIELFVPNPQ